MQALCKAMPGNEARRMERAGMHALTPLRTPLLLLLLAAALLAGAGYVPECRAADRPVIRVGCKTDFSPYSFVDAQGRPAGFGVDLIQAVADKMGLSIAWSTGSWDTEWNALVSGQLDVLPVVAMTHQRMGLVEFSFPHTETFDAFFVRRGAPPIPDLAAAQGKSIVTMRSDVAHHELLEHHITGDLALVDSIPEGLALVSSGRRDAFLGSLLICSLAIQKHGIPGLAAGTPIPDYKRVFSFGVKNGEHELREKLNQGLLLIKSTGEYDTIYRKWLTIEDPVLRYRPLLISAIPAAITLILIAGVVLGIRRRIVLRRNVELSTYTALLEKEIAERKQAEDALRESEAMLRQILDSVPQSIFWKDVNSVYLGCNKVFAQVSGLSGPEQIVGKTDFDLPWPTAEADAYRADDAGVIARNAPKLHILEPLQHADGTRAWIDTSKMPLLDTRREVRGVLGVFDNVTEKKRAEEALRESEARHRALFESMGEGACILDAVRDTAGAMIDFRIVNVNPAYTTTLNVPRERAIGALVRDLFGLSQPPDLEEYSRVLETGLPASFETAIPEIGMHFHVSAFRLGPDRFVSMFQDITTRKRAEDALRRRLEMEQVLAGISSQLVGVRFDEIENNLPELLGIVAETIHADTGRVCSFESDGETCLATWGAGDSAATEGLCHSQEGHLQALVMPRLNVFESVVIRRPEDLPPEATEVRAEFEAKGIRSLLAVPMVKGKTLIGCLAFTAMGAPRDWSSEDVAMLETLGGILANGLESARLERAMAYKERRYFDLIDNLSEGMMYVNRNGIIMLVNKSMARMLGYESDELLGTSPKAYMTDEKSREFSDKFRERMQGKSEKYPFELVHKDGSRVYVQISASPVCDEQGNVAGSMALINDLTKERLLQLQLVQSQRLEAIGQLAAGIAHEINTPTQYVDNNTQFLRGAFENLQAVLQEHDALLQEARGVPALAAAVHRVEAAREERQTDALLTDIPGAFNDASDGLQRISLIVNSVKQFAHPGQRAMQPADLNEALRSTIVVARNEWKYVAEVATELDPDLPLVPCVLSDINQVALNLIVNAAQAIAAAPGRAPDEKGLITVRTRTEDDWAVIEVQDTGNGIPVDIRPRIFDPFFTTKEVGKGTGQGLAIARAVVAEKHHGIITFETEEGKGTTFSVRLPLAQNHGKDEP